MKINWSFIEPVRDQATRLRNDLPAQSAIVKLAEQQAEIERLCEENARLRDGYDELDEIANSNDVMMMKRKVLRRHLRGILRRAAFRDGGEG